MSSPTAAAAASSSLLWGRALLIGSFLFLIHAILQTIQFRHYVRNSGEEEETLPIDIVIECLLSLALGIYGSILWAGEFLPIQAAQNVQHKSYDTLFWNEDFAVYNHRGKALAALQRQKTLASHPEEIPVDQS